jgi:trigger factor
MSVTVETLEKLERKITLTLPVSVVQTEVDSRLRRLSKTVRMDGFRPGKVPLNVVAQRYGYSVQYEVVNDKVGEVFTRMANEAKLRVAGSPTITEKEGAPEGEIAFDAVFEVFPEVQIADLADAELQKYTAEVTDDAVAKTLDILRKQRRTFAQRSLDSVAAEGDRLTVNFEGKIDGDPFPGGKAEDFQFIIGEGQMLKEFESAATGMKVGESKTFPLSFPADYHGKDVAGKTADFMVTITKMEASHLPEVNEALAKSLGIADATVEGLHADIRKNLGREVQSRVLARNKQAAMDLLVAKASLDLPKAIVKSEIERLIQSTRADLKQRGMKDADTMAIPEEMFNEQAERRVRLGLVVGELVRSNELHAKPEQVQAYIEDMAASYERPADVIRWYGSDKQRLAEVEAIVVENNVTNFVFSKAKVTEATLGFDELMAQQA